MRLRLRRGWWLALLLAAPLGLGGCVYLRLLEFKRQLADFDRHFTLDARDGLKLTCKEPVLLDRDMAYLGLAPATRQKSGRAERWHFRWVKQHAPADPAGAVYDQTVDFVFVNRRLTTILVPERFFVFFPKPVVIAGLRAVGRGQIDQGRRRLTTEVKPQELPPLLVANLETILGAPVEQRGAGASHEWRYVFVPESATPKSGPLDLTFVIDAKKRSVQRIRGRLLIGEFEFTYPQPPARG